MQPPPTRTIAIVFLAITFVFAALQLYSIIIESRIEVTSLFVVPGIALLGMIGLVDPRVTSSLQPGARGYPLHVRVIAHACWVVSLIIGAILYFALVE